MTDFHIYLILGITNALFLSLAIAIRINLAKKRKDYRRLREECEKISFAKALASSELESVRLAVKNKEKENEILRQKQLELSEKLAASIAVAAAREQELQEKVSFLEKLRDDLCLKFKNISADVIKAQHDSFKSEQTDVLTALLNPFQSELKAFKEEVVAAREQSLKTKSGLDVQLQNLLNLNEHLTKEAENLAEALKGSKKAQGCWGEYQLGRILEISGLVQGRDYDTEEVCLNDDKRLLRPDVIIHLPDSRDIIVDAKVSLNDYLSAVNADSPEASAVALKKNLAAIKAHIDELSKKEYHKLLKGRTLNYVIMFLPVESAYIAALKEDNSLYDYAYKKNVILATPLSLMPVLRTVENLWKVDAQNKNVAEIAEWSGRIYDKLAAFIEDMQAIDRALNQAGKAYNAAMTKLSGRNSAISYAEKIKTLGAKTGKLINFVPANGDVLSLTSENENPPSQTGEQNA